MSEAIKNSCFLRELHRGIQTPQKKATPARARWESWLRKYGNRLASARSTSHVSQFAKNVPLLEPAFFGGKLHGLHTKVDTAFY